MLPNEIMRYSVISFEFPIIKYVGSVSKILLNISNNSILHSVSDGPSQYVEVGMDRVIVEEEYLHCDSIRSGENYSNGEYLDAPSSRSADENEHIVTEANG